MKRYNFQRPEWIMPKYVPRIAALFLISGMLWMWPTFVQAIRLKDITDIQGVRGNQLVGYGLVVGLEGTGDGRKSKFTTYSLASMLDKMGMTIDPEELKVQNVAAVMVTAELPPFARAGTRLDTVVSSIGDAKNLQGGTLLLTPLKAADGKVYAVAQGSVSTGGFYAAGGGASVQKNFPTVARMVDGAVIERSVGTDFAQKDEVILTLHQPDFTTVSRVKTAIDDTIVGQRASTPDPGTVIVPVPEAYRSNVVQFITLLESVEVTPDAIAKVVVNERTGTVVLGENVRIDTVAISHGNLSIQVNEGLSVSQPGPLSQGQTVATPNTDINVKEGTMPIQLMTPGVTIGEVVRALNAVGVSPRDLISIFQALKAAGALRATLEVM
jgi:flagellar P-ring protein FlgI